MSLRAKLIAVFAVFGVVPIVALGVFTYLRSMQAVQDLIATRTSTIAQRAAQEIQHAYALRQADLLLLAENAETQRLCRAHASGDSGALQAALHAADDYLRRAWNAMGASYRWVEFHDTAGEMLYELGAPNRSRATTQGSSGHEGYDDLVVTQPIRDLETGREAGTLTAAIPLRNLLPEDALSVSFGRAGYSAVIDRSQGQVLYHTRRTLSRQPVSTLLGSQGWDLDELVLAEESGDFAYENEGTPRVASFVSLATPPWTVVASASVAEFAPPFARTRLVNILLVLLVAALISVLFLVVTRRMTRSLGALTSAADQVAQGNFTPDLPPSGHDEVGRLSGAFALMVQQVGETLRRIQESRHMAAIGQFASQLSHEIRNPLTSIKLNLQGLDRGIADKRIPREYAGPLAICLREVKRLERVAGGVLSIARTRSTRRVSCSVRAAVDEGLETLRPQLSERGIELHKDLRASHDTVRGDPEKLKGVFFNLFLNAADAMPDGGLLEVSSETATDGRKAGPVIRVRVADSGPGVPTERRGKIFEPFFSTKEEGTGFGLALAQQAVEEHDGVLRLEQDDHTNSGAAFVVELPLAIPEKDQ
jgi:signal transduction histidine kinase